MKAFLKEVLAIEGNLECVKKDLVIRPDFTLNGVFKLFTNYSSSRITASDMMYGLERIGVICDIADTKLVLSRFD
jgi:hypothetical protein